MYMSSYLSIYLSLSLSVRRDDDGGVVVPGLAVNNYK